jgi:RNA polymerase sigma factor (sigma-70 family)
VWSEVVGVGRGGGFEESFEPLRRVAYRVAFRLLGQRQAAEDVAAETLARAYSRWSSVADHAEPWVVTVATNLSLDVGRRRAKEAGRRVLIDESAPDLQVETRLDLQRALAALPRRQREVVALRFLGDFSERATAEALGVDVGTVKSHTSRGLSRLRVLVEGV